MFLNNKNTSQAESNNEITDDKIYNLRTLYPVDTKINYGDFNDYMHYKITSKMCTFISDRLLACNP